MVIKMVGQVISETHLRTVVWCGRLRNFSGGEDFVPLPAINLKIGHFCLVSNLAAESS
jgi:hypothetical protein